MTGLRPSTTGIYGNRTPEVGKTERGHPRTHLREHGYRVTGRGKIFNGRYPDPANLGRVCRKGQRPGSPGSILTCSLLNPSRFPRSTRMTLMMYPESGSNSPGRT